MYVSKAGNNSSKSHDRSMTMIAALWPLITGLHKRELAPTASPSGNNMSQAQWVEDRYPVATATRLMSKMCGSYFSGHQFMAGGPEAALPHYHWLSSTCTNQLLDLSRVGASRCDSTFLATASWLEKQIILREKAVSSGSCQFICSCGVYSESLSNSLLSSTKQTEGHFKVAIKPCARQVPQIVSGPSLHSKQPG